MEAVTRAELEEAERAQGVRLEEGDIFVFRTGHHRRRRERGAWDNTYAGEGKAITISDPSGAKIPATVTHKAFYDPDGEKLRS